MTDTANALHPPMPPHADRCRYLACESGEWFLCLFGVHCPIYNGEGGSQEINYYRPLIGALMRTLWNDTTWRFEENSNFKEWLNDYGHDLSRLNMHERQMLGNEYKDEMIEKWRVWSLVGAE